MKNWLKRLVCFLYFNHADDVVSFKDIEGSSDFYIIHQCRCGKKVRRIGPVDDNALMGHGSGVK